MMDCDHTSELLPWYLNDTLSDEDRRRVEEHLQDCVSCQRELERTSFAGAAFGQHLPEEVLVDFGFGRSTAGYDRATIEEHLAICERCREELEMVRESHGSLEDSPAPLPFPPAPHKTEIPAPSTARLWRWGTLAATLAALVGASGWLWNLGEVRRLEDRLAELEAPQTDVRVFEIYPTEPILRSEDPPPAQVRIPADTATVTLLLVPDDRQNTAADYELQLIDADSEVRWLRRDIRPQPEGDFAVTLRVDTLAPGHYTLQLVAVTGEERRAVADYSIEIERALSRS